MVGICFVLMLVLLGRAAAADPGHVGYLPAPENLTAREWFRDAKFGLFIHWGIYSLKEDGEWVMHRSQIPKTEYQKLAGNFYPYAFGADEWCEIAKAAGMRYITITSKHHDGFAMYDSAVSDYDMIDATPFKRDILKELAEACERHGLKLFFYYSQLDWQHEDYFPRGRTGGFTARPESGDWDTYLDYMDAQLTELLTGYGEIGGIWFDGMWDRPDADWRLGKTYQLIHELQPAALIGSNHHVSPIPGEDFQMFEKGLPGESPFDKKARISDLPLETCDTINNSWGFNAHDLWLKSDRDLIHYLVRAAGMNANLLLNIGPRPDGAIAPGQVRKLKMMGDWMSQWGHTIYDSRMGPYRPSGWGVSTEKDGQVYLHVLSMDQSIVLPPIDQQITGARLLDGTPLVFEIAASGTILQLPEQRPDPYDTIIALDYR